MTIVQAVRSKDKEQLLEAATALSLTPDEVNLLIEFMSGKMERSLLYTVTRKGAQFRDVAALARGLKSGTSDFLLDAIISGKMLDIVVKE
jgi:hypothetical protein